MKLYVASSWRNPHQPFVVEALLQAGHQPYDFRNPPGRTGFAWSEIDPAWEGWSHDQYLAALEHPLARAGFASDHDAMDAADGCVLVLPCGRSAHIEAGEFPGSGRPLWILLASEPEEPELMYRSATGIARDLPELLRMIGAHPPLVRPVGLLATHLIHLMRSREDYRFLLGAPSRTWELLAQEVGDVTQLRRLVGPARAAHAAVDELRHMADRLMAAARQLEEERE